jgi:hypothetical protein
VPFFARLSAPYLHHLVPLASSMAFRRRLLHELVPADTGSHHGSSASSGRPLMGFHGSLRDTSYDNRLTSKMKRGQGFSFAWEAGFSSIFFLGLTALSPPRPLMPFTIADRCASRSFGATEMI